MKRTCDDNDIEERKARQKHVNQLTSFKIEPLGRFDSKFPYYRQPVEVGTFSQNSDRMFVPDKSQQKIYSPPNNEQSVSFDLAVGYESFIKRDDQTKEYLDDLLKWVLLNPSSFQCHPQKTVHLSHECDEQTTATTGTTTSHHIKSLHTDFICWRGLLTKLLCSPYENREGWKVAACKLYDTVYLCEFDTDDRKQQRAVQTDMQKEMTYWGYKFEQYVTADMNEGSLPVTDVPVNNHEGFGSVVRTRLGRHSLVFGGEVDCCKEQVKQHDKKSSYIELKTSREITNHRQDRNFKRFKLIKWWAQSFLIGIPEIICGFRDDKGVVHQLERFPVQDIPTMCKGIDNPWKAAVCFNFLDQLLQHIQTQTNNARPGEVLLFECYPGREVTCTVYDPGSQYDFLPHWYTPNHGNHVCKYRSGDETQRLKLT